VVGLKNNNNSGIIERNLAVEINDANCTLNVLTTEMRKNQIFIFN